MEGLPCNNFPFTATLSRSVTLYPAAARQRNVSGEMLGAMFAVRWAIKNGFTRIELRYDYEGIEKWVTGAWKSRTELTQKYAAAMRRWMGSIQMRFTKVAAHTNVYYNELADRLSPPPFSTYTVSSGRINTQPKAYLLRECS